ncbi:nucleotide exchange factor GrpE [Desulfovibrio aminophilus]|uniref:nucleotide exchange factor GrpE n=1 Tax=Desulfovibrio aminophilus TaxID=81425 RepID=UPI00339953A8
MSFEESKDREIPVVNCDDASGGAPELTLSEEELAALCKSHVCPGCEVMKQAEDVRLRSLAEADNTRKRLSRETEELRRFACQSVLADLLPVLDNLDLALNHAPGEGCKDFVLGVEMTRKVFLDILKNHGLTPVDETGVLFDPNRHEALGAVQDPNLPDGFVTQVAQKGYLLKDRLLRPAKVLVNKPQ